MHQVDILGPEQTRQEFTDDRVRCFAETIIAYYERKQAEDLAASQSRIERHAGRILSAATRLFKGKKKREGEITEMQSLLAGSRDNGQLFTARVGEKIVATTGYRLIGSDSKTHKPVWEIVQVFVSDEHRGNKLSWTLMDAAENAIRKADPIANIVIVSDHKTVQNWAKARQYGNITLKDHWEIEHPSETLPNQKKAEFQGKANTLLAFRK